MRYLQYQGKGRDVVVGGGGGDLFSSVNWVRKPLNEERAPLSLVRS